MNAAQGKWRVMSVLTSPGSMHMALSLCFALYLRAKKEIKRKENALSLDAYGLEFVFCIVPSEEKKGKRKEKKMSYA